MTIARENMKTAKKKGASGNKKIRGEERSNEWRRERPADGCCGIIGPKYFLIEAEKMYTAAQQYRAEAATTKKKERETRGRIEGEGAREWAGERAER